jgi:uncharacterized protein involved in exopolysaccharide biosynthesis
MMSNLGNIAGMFGLGGNSGNYVLPMMITEIDLWAYMAKSSAVLDSIIVKENLIEKYDVDDLQAARGKLEKRTSVEIKKSGPIAIGVKARTPEYSAYLTNLLVKELDKLNRSIRLKVNEDKSDYLNNSISEYEIRLAAVEDTLLLFQRNYGLVSIEDQARIAIESAAAIKGQIIMTQLDLQYAQMNYSSKHFKVDNLKKKLDKLENQLSRMESGNQDGNSFFAISLDDVPELSLEYARLLRDAKTMEIVYTFLIQQQEQSKLESLNNQPEIRVLSKAIPPNKKCEPKRGIIAVIAGFLAFVITLSSIILREFLKEISADNPECYRSLKKELGFILPDFEN